MRLAALAECQSDLGRQYLIVEICAGLVAHAAALVRRHALRGYDAAQWRPPLKGDTTLSGLVLVSADGELNAAAIADSAVENPNCILRKSTECEIRRFWSECLRIEFV